MSDIVKYQNQVNELPIFKLQEVEQDILMALLSQTSFNNDQWIKLTLYELLDKVKFTRDSVVSMEDKVDSLLRKIFEPYISVKTDQDVVRLFVCFDKIEYNRKTYELKVHIQDDFYQMIKNYELGFTRFELAEFVSLSGNYTKTLYRFLKQYRTQGTWLVSIEDFKKLLNIPDNYRQCNIDARVLKPALKQLSQPFKKLKVEKLKKTGRGSRGRGGVITALKFTFDAEKLKEVPEEKKTVQNAAPKATKTAQIPTAQTVKSPFKAEE